MADDSLSACLAEIKAKPGRFYVYILARPCGTPFYVGKGTKERIALHSKEAASGKLGHRQSIIRKIWMDGGNELYRIDSFHDDHLGAYSREEVLIANIGRRSSGGPLVNRTDGGDGCRGFDPDTIRRFSASLKSSEKAREQRKRLAAAKKGTPHSATHTAAIVAAIRASERRREAVKRVSESQKGRSYSEETLKKMSAAAQGRHHSEETKAKMRASQLRRSDDNRDMQNRVWSDPSYRERQSAVKRGRPLDPIQSASAIAGMRAFWSDESRCSNSRKKLSEVTRRNWADPAFREKMRLAREAKK